ncbi:hypothetical protein NDA16_001623 [Ustilago loliicola]|nr:hypothetical protein NDA16_001623 [Ustilago loliicola]
MIDSYRGVRDAQRITRLSATLDFPFIFTKSLEFAFFRTYGIPTISSLLLHTGQLGKAENAGRRYVDTSALIQAFTTFPVPRLDLPDGGEAEASNAKEGEENWELFGESLDDPRSAIALARVNYLHGRWKNKISNDDLLYTLSARASDGKSCPVGGHLHARTPANKEEGGFKPATWRMELKWYENDPVYSRPYSKGSAGWYVEEVKIALGLLKKEDRRGASKWMPATLPVPGQVKGKDEKEGDLVEGLGGFRLEELGPKGLELKGRKEVLADAERLFGGRIEGKWAFEP